MTLLFMEGFDSLGAVDQGDMTTVLSKVGWVDTNRNKWMDNSHTRTGRGGCLSWNPSTAGGASGSAWGYFAYPNRRTVYQGFAARYDAGTGFDMLWRLQYDNLKGTVYNQITIYHNDVNGISVINGDDELIAYSDPNVIFGDTWNYLEVYAKAGLTDGELTVKVNGCAVITETGLKTMDASAGAYYNRAGALQNHTSIGGTNGANYLMLDDIYVCDDQGSGFNNFLGDVVIDDMLPTADVGSPLNGMTVIGSAGGHFASVDEFPPDDDTTYLTTNDSDIIERFECDDLPTDVIDVLAVQVSAHTRREGTAYKSFRTQVTVGANTLEGADRFAASTYTEQGTIFTQVPGGSGWTVADVNAMQIGIRTTS